MHMKNSRKVRESAQFSHVKLFETPRTAAYQVPPSMGFARQGYWSGLPLPSPITKFSQFSSFTQSCQTLCDPMNPSMPGLPVHHQLSEFTQTHVHRVRDAIQPSHSLSSPSPPTPNPSQHQGLFQWVNSSHEVAKVLEFQLSASVLPMNTQDWFHLGWTGWTPCSPKDSQESSPTPQFWIINSSVLSFLHSQTLTSYITTGKTIALTRQTFVGEVMSLLFNMLSWLVITFLPRSKHQH